MKIEGSVQEIKEFIKESKLKDTVTKIDGAELRKEILNDMQQAMPQFEMPKD